MYKNFMKLITFLSILIAPILLITSSSVFAKTTKVGFVYLTTPGDHGWTYAHELGKQMVEKEFGNEVKISVVENVPEGPDATRVIRELAKQGNEIIFTTSFGYMEPTLKVAKEFPNIKFEHMTGYKRTKNVYRHWSKNS